VLDDLVRSRLGFWPHDRHPLTHWPDWFYEGRCDVLRCPRENCASTSLEVWRLPAGPHPQANRYYGIVCPVCRGGFDTRELDYRAKRELREWSRALYQAVESERELREWSRALYQAVDSDGELAEEAASAVDNDGRLPAVVQDVNGYRIEPGADLRGEDLRGEDLTGADLSGADLSGADLSGADLSGANLSEAYLFNARLIGALLTDANLEEVWGGFIPEYSLVAANLSGANLKGANLKGAHFGGGGTLFHGADLTGADLTGADFTGADFTGADLTGADFTGADFGFAKLTGADLTGVTFCGVKWDTHTAWPGPSETDDDSSFGYRGAFDRVVRPRWNSLSTLDRQNSDWRHGQLAPTDPHSFAIFDTYTYQRSHIDAFRRIVELAGIRPPDGTDHIAIVDIGAGACTAAIGLSEEWRPWEVSRVCYRGVEPHPTMRELGSELLNICCPVRSVELTENVRDLTNVSEDRVVVALNYVVHQGGVSDSDVSAWADLIAGYVAHAQTEVLITTANSSKITEPDRTVPLKNELLNRTIQCQEWKGTISVPPRWPRDEGGWPPLRDRRSSDYENVKWVYWKVCPPELPF